MSQLGYDDTPFISGDRYRVHDDSRPQPPVVTPGTDGGAPSDATVLFDGSSLDGWEKGDGSAAAGWKLEDGYMEVVPRTGNIRTKASFGSMQLHLEFASPEEVKGDGQGRGNSGVFFMGIYEVQVLDCYQNPTYADGSTGGLYGQCPPLVNACRAPGEWQSYDMIWEAPLFVGDELVRPAAITVLLNNVLLHHRKELLGPTQHRVTTRYEAHGDGPLMLQDHGDLVRFRNIWCRPIGTYDAG